MLCNPVRGRLRPEVTGSTSEPKRCDVINLGRWYTRAPIALALAAVAACGTGTTPQADQQGADPSTSTQASSLAPYPSESPEEMQEGVAYQIDLATHCGIDILRIGGTDWRAQPPVPAPDPDGEDLSRAWPDRVDAVVERVDSETLRLTIGKDSPVGGGDVVTFQRSDEPPPPCD